MHEKLNSYSKYVKEMYWPKISEAKRQELEAIVSAPKSSLVRRSAHVKEGKVFGQIQSARNLVSAETGDQQVMQSN